VRIEIFEHKKYRKKEPYNLEAKIITLQNGYLALRANGIKRARVYKV
jgi:hypothetical protein